VNGIHHSLSDRSAAAAAIGLSSFIVVLPLTTPP